MVPPGCNEDDHFLHDQQPFYGDQQPAILPPVMARILMLLAEGLSAKEIAAELGMKEYTVNNMRKQLLRKLGAKNMAHLVAIGFRNGWIG